MSERPSRIGFRVVERFDSTCEAWPSYIAWIKLSHLTEVAGLDCSLCPTAAIAESDADWQHSLYSEYISGIFDDWTYALDRVERDRDLNRLQIIAVLREPTVEELRDLAPDGFDHLGFDLIEEATCISALNNCDGFERALLPEDLNERGLVPGITRAYDIRQKLLEEYQDEPHADCAVWAVWRRRERPTRGCS